MARRPLLISTMSPFSFFSLLAFLEMPKGSYKSNGTGCGTPAFWRKRQGQGVKGHAIISAWRF